MTYKDINIFIVLFFIGTSNALKQELELKHLSPFEKIMSEITPETYDDRELVFEDTYFCDECSEHFQNKTNLSFHVLFKKHKTQIAKCPFNGCDIFLNSLKDLPEHIAQYHNSRQCPWCLKNFLKKTALVRHMNKKHTCIAMPCPHDTCNRWFFSKKEWRNHIIESHSTVLCPLCLKTFSKQITLAIHLFKHGVEPKLFICPHDQCSFCSESKDLLFNHLTTKKHHPSNEAAYVDANNPYWWRFWQLMGKDPEKFTKNHGLYEKAFTKND